MIKKIRIEFEKLIKNPPFKYLLWACLGLISILLVAEFLKLMAALNDFYDKLYAKSPWVAHSFVGTLIVALMAATGGILIFKFRKPKSISEAHKEYEFKTVEEGLSGVKERLSDPTQTLSPSEQNSVEFVDDTIHLTLYGYKSVGKSSLAAVMKNGVFSTDRQIPKPLNIRIEEFDLSVKADKNDLPSDIFHDPGRHFLLVADRDLRDFELEKFKRILKNTSNVFFALNKTDLIAEEDIKVIANSICEKLSRIINSTSLLCISADPRPKMVIKIDEAGNETEKEIAVSADIYQLKEGLTQLAEKYGYSNINIIDD